MASRCLVACADLMTSSRLHQTVRAAGLEPVPVRGLDALIEAHAAEPAVAVLVDLTDPAGGLPVVAAAVDLQPRPKVLAIGPHVEAEMMRMAREAGADHVLPHSATGDPLRAELADAATTKAGD